MYTRSPRLVLLGLLALAVVVLVLSKAAAAPILSSTSGAVAITPLQDATPTSAEASKSEAGSTDSIMWMGLIIVAIIMLPILTRKSLWH